MSSFFRPWVSALLLVTLASAGPAAAQVGSRRSMGNLPGGVRQSMGNFFVPFAAPLPAAPFWTPPPRRQALVARVLPPNRQNVQAPWPRSNGNLFARDPRAVPAVQGPGFRLNTEAGVRRAQERRQMANLRPEDPTAVPAIHGSNRTILWPPAEPDPGAQPAVTPTGVRDQEAFRRRSMGNYPARDPTTVPAIEGTGRLRRTTDAAIGRAEQSRTQANLRFEDPSTVAAIHGSDSTIVLPAAQPAPGPDAQPSPAPQPDPAPVPRDDRPEQWQLDRARRMWYDPPTGQYYRYDPRNRQFLPVFGLQRR